MSESADVIVVGLGAMGSAACMQLAARGASVLGIDRYAPPHEFGSTHGETRMTRVALGEGAEYVPLVRRSHELWRELEQRTGTRLLNQPGGVVLGASDSEFLGQTRASAAQYEIAHENLTSAELASRFPMFRISEGIEGYYESEAGYVRPERAVRLQLQAAREYGATLKLSEPVLRWSACGEGVEVVSEKRTYRSERLVLCPGSWITELFPEGRELFGVYRQLLFWFPIRERYELFRDMPVFVWDCGGEKDDRVHLLGFYGFPAVGGADGGIKVATESYERTTVPDGQQHPASASEATQMYEDYIAPHVRWVGPEPLRSASCLYTVARESRFLIDRHPDHDQVLIVSACSGHGFKHSPAIGEAVAQWVSAGTPELDLSPFALARVLR